MNPFYRYLVRAREVDPNSINTVDSILLKLNRVIIESGLVQQKSLLHQFYAPGSLATPLGLTGIYFFNSQKGGLVRRPGHLTIHTWPETGSYALDYFGAEENRQILKTLTDALPGEYQIITEHGGALSGSELSQQFGRQTLAHLINPSNLQSLNPEKVLPLLEEVSQEARFRIAEEIKTGARKEIVYFNNDYLSSAVILTTSHLSLHYLPKEKPKKENSSDEKIVVVDCFTCTEGGKDEGNPETGLEILVEKLRPEEIRHKVFLRR